MDYDFAIIGGGSAGYAAARTAADQGLKTVVIEGGREIGGLCILRGCMPSKTLIESANRNLTLRRAAEFGLRASQLEVHAGEIIARKRRLIGEFAGYRREQLESGKFDFVRGFAKFSDPHTVEITGLDGASRALTARSFLIATGSEINKPNVPGLADCGFLTSDDILELEELPDSIIVLGAGPVALEMAHYLEALGVKVTVIQRGPHLLTGTDPDIAGALEHALRKRGLAIFTGAAILGIECPAGRKRIRFRHREEEKSLEASSLLNALGRNANIHGLALDAAAIGVERGKIRVNSHLQSGQPHVFAAGDSAGPLEIVHIAVEQGELAARNAARLLAGDPEDAFESMDYRLKLFAVFTEPQVAVAGLSEAEARDQGIDYATATHPFDDHGKSLVMGESEGFVKLMADRKSGEIIGGSVTGPHASDLIHEIVVAMAFHATAAQLANVPHYHPTLSEIWTYPAGELADSTA